MDATSVRRAPARGSSLLEFELSSSLLGSSLQGQLAARCWVVRCWGITILASQLAAGTSPSGCWDISILASPFAAGASPSPAVGLRDVVSLLGHLRLRHDECRLRPRILGGLLMSYYGMSPWWARQPAMTSADFGHSAWAAFSCCKRIRSQSDQTGTSFLFTT